MPEVNHTEVNNHVCATAQDLMRSRFEAFKHGDVAWLLKSWHPDTRPATIEIDPELKWRRLQIVDVTGGEPDDSSGIVEFRATYIDSSGHGVLHERSRFTKVAGNWVYIDGEIID